MIPRTLNWRVIMNTENRMSVDKSVTNIYWLQVLNFGIEVVTKDVQYPSRQNNESIFEVLP